MSKKFTASISQEGELFVAQCIEVDIASQGETENEALRNLKEALELYFSEPKATVSSKLAFIEVEVGAA